MTKVVKLRLLRTELVRQTDRYSTYVVSPVAHVAPGWQCRRRRNPINSLFLCLFPSAGDSRSVRSSVGRSVVSRRWRRRRTKLANPPEREKTFRAAPLAVACLATLGKREDWSLGWPG